ncbi:MAG: Cof-type HAD-IIB family hydrolase [Oscillospiraceae bacterium]
MQKKILAVDIDGTLVTKDKKILIETKNAILDFIDRGGIFILASGRPTKGMMPYVEELNLKSHGGYIMSYNGANVIDAKTGELIFDQSFTSENIKDILDATENINAGVTTYYKDYAVTENADDAFFNLAVKINGLYVKKVKSLRKELKYPVSKFLLTGEPNYMKELEIELREKLPFVNVFRSEPYFIEIAPSGIDKGSTILKLAELLNVKTEEIMACGDGFNDITMLKAAGIGVAMENAQEITKKSADFITKSNENNGIAYAMKKYAF